MAAGSLLARNLRVLRLRAQGMTQAQVGVCVGISGQRVAQILKELGAPKYVHRRSIEAIVKRDFDEIERWVADGGTFCELAKKYGVDYDAFLIHCHRLGIYGHLAAPESEQLIWVDLYVKEKLSTHAIAKRTGRNQATIHKCLQRRGITRSRRLGIKLAMTKIAAP